MLKSKFPIFISSIDSRQFSFITDTSSADDMHINELSKIGGRDWSESGRDIMFALSIVGVSDSKSSTRVSKIGSDISGVGLTTANQVGYIG